MTTIIGYHRSLGLSSEKSKKPEGDKMSGAAAALVLASGLVQGHSANLVWEPRPRAEVSE